MSNLEPKDMVMWTTKPVSVTDTDKVKRWYQTRPPVPRNGVKLEQFFAALGLVNPVAYNKFAKGLHNFLGQTFDDDVVRRTDGKVSEAKLNAHVATLAGLQELMATIGEAKKADPTLSEAAALAEAREQIRTKLASIDAQLGNGRPLDERAAREQHERWLKTAKAWRESVGL